MHRPGVNKSLATSNVTEKIDREIDVEFTAHAQVVMSMLYSSLIWFRIQQILLQSLFPK